MIRNTMAVSRTLRNSLADKLLAMMTSDWFLKVLESNASEIE